MFRMQACLSGRDRSASEQGWNVNVFEMPGLCGHLPGEGNSVYLVEEG